MCMDRFDPYFTGFIMSVCFFLTTAVLYILVFQERDQIGYEIMMCMRDDHSREKYEECRINVLASRQTVAAGELVQPSD